MFELMLFQAQSEKRAMRAMRSAPPGSIHGESGMAGTKEVRRLSATSDASDDQRGSTRIRVIRSVSPRQRTQRQEMPPMVEEREEEESQISNEAKEEGRTTNEAKEERQATIEGKEENQTPDEAKGETQGTNEANEESQATLETIEESQIAAEAETKEEDNQEDQEMKPDNPEDAGMRETSQGNDTQPEVDNEQTAVGESSEPVVAGCSELATEQPSTTEDNAVESDETSQLAALLSSMVQMGDKPTQTFQSSNVTDETQLQVGQTEEMAGIPPPPPPPPRPPLPEDTEPTSPALAIPPAPALHLGAPAVPPPRPPLPEQTSAIPQPPPPPSELTLAQTVEKTATEEKKEETTAGMQVCIGGAVYRASEVGFVQSQI